MTDEYVQQNGHRTDEKASLIRRMWPNDLPEVNVEVVGYPDEDLICYQVSYTVDEGLYGKEIPEDVDDQLETEEFEAVARSVIDGFRDKYQELTI